MFYIVDINGRCLGLPAYTRRSDAAAVAALLNAIVVTQ